MRWPEKFLSVAVLALLGAAGAAWAAADEEDDFVLKAWQEAEFQLPASSRPSDLQPFYVSAATANRFFVDPASISVGSDGVVRYTLVVKTDDGATNVSYEGMRCETRERRAYAFGRNDGSWSRSRSDRWVKVREAEANRQYAALFREYFCPEGVIVANAAEAIDALRRGGHPILKRW